MERLLVTGIDRPVGIDLALVLAAWLCGYSCAAVEYAPADCVETYTPEQDEPWTRDECNRCMQDRIESNPGRSPW